MVSAPNIQYGYPVEGIIMPQRSTWSPLLLTSFCPAATSSPQVAGGLSGSSPASRKASLL